MFYDGKMLVKYVSSPTEVTLYGGVSNKTYDLSEIEPFNGLVCRLLLKEVPDIYIESLKYIINTHDIVMHVLKIDKIYDKTLSGEINYYLDCECTQCETERTQHVMDVTDCRCDLCPNILNYIIDVLVKDIHGKAKKRGFFTKLLHRYLYRTNHMVMHNT